MKKIIPCLFLGFAFVGAATLGFAQTASTVPVGVVSVSIAAGTGTVATDSFISLPLLSLPEGSGQLVGKITSVASSSLSNSAAQWAASSFSLAGSPFFVRITSGNAIGRIFLVTANTATDMTVDNGGTDLTTLGMNPGTDTYEVFPGDTIVSVFGTPSLSNPIVGGASASAAVDKLYLMENGAWVTYFYNTTVSQWRRGSLPVSQNTKALNPNSPVLFSRIGNTPLPLSFLGRVPDTANVFTINSNGDTGMASFFPVDQTLGSFSLQSLANWKKVGDPGITSSNADKVFLFENGAWVAFHYNGTASQWRRGALPTSQNTKVIPSGSGMLVQRTGTSGMAPLSVALPYSFN